MAEDQDERYVRRVFRLLRGLGGPVPRVRAASRLGGGCQGKPQETQDQGMTIQFPYVLFFVTNE